MMASSSTSRQHDEMYRTVNSVLRKYCPTVADISSPSDLNARTFLRLFEATCGPFLQERPLLPDVDRDPIGFLQGLVDIVACDFLNVDLAPKITGQKLAMSDAEAVSSFVTMLDKVYTCLHEDDQQTTDHQPDQVPTRTKLTPPLRRLGQRSVLYSPRTAFRRSSNRATVVRQSIKDAVRRMRPTILEPRLQSSILRESQPSDMASATHRLQMRQIALNSRVKDVDWSATTTKARFDIIERTKEAGQRRREHVELQRARSVLNNAKKAARHRAILDARRQDEFHRRLVAQQLQIEARKMIAAEKVRESWTESANAAKSELASRSRAQAQAKNITVLDRIAALENRQRIREQIIRDQYNLD